MRKKKKSFFKKIIYFFFIVLTCFIAFQFIYPDISKLRKENPKKTAMMEYREEEWKEKRKKGGITQKWVPYSRISPFMTKAVLIGEDDKFWQHEGFDYTAMQKAIEKDIKAKKFKFGGSTISQQLAKNLYLSPSKNPIRKIREAIITWRIEKALSKKRILEIYLNVAEWGEGIFGIEAASRHYYGIPASSLSPEQAARLASVLPNPRRFNPLGEQKYVVHRANLIYSIMVKRGIVPPEFEEISEDKETVSPTETEHVPIEETKSSQ